MSTQSPTSPEPPDLDSHANAMNDVDNAGTSLEPSQTRPSYPQTSPSRSSSSSIPSLSGSPTAPHSSDPSKSVHPYRQAVQHDDSHESRSIIAIGMNRRDALSSLPVTASMALDLGRQERECPNETTVCVGNEDHQILHSRHGSSPEQRYCESPSHDASLHDQPPDDASSTHDLSSETGPSYDRSSQDSPSHSESFHMGLSHARIAHHASDSPDMVDSPESSNERPQPESFGGTTPYQENRSPTCSPFRYSLTDPPPWAPFSSLAPTPIKQDTGTSPGRPNNPLHRSFRGPDGFDQWGQEIRNSIQAQGESFREVLGGIEVRIDASRSEIVDGLREEVRDQSETMKHELSAEIDGFKAVVEVMLSEFDNPASSILSELRELAPQMGRAEERFDLQMSELRDNMRRLNLEMREIREKKEDTETLDSDSDCDTLFMQVEELSEHMKILKQKMSTMSLDHNELHTTVRMQRTSSEMAREATEASLTSLKEAIERMKIDIRERNTTPQQVLQDITCPFSTSEKHESHRCDMPKSHHGCLAKLADRDYINGLKDDLKTSLESSTDTLVNALRTDLQNLRIDFDNSHKTFLAQISEKLGRDVISIAHTAVEKHTSEAEENFKRSVKVGKRVRFEDVVSGGEPRKQLKSESVQHVLSSPSAFTVSEWLSFCSTWLPVLFFVACLVVLSMSWLLGTTRR